MERTVRFAHWGPHTDQKVSGLSDLCWSDTPFDWLRGLGPKLCVALSEGQSVNEFVSAVPVKHRVTGRRLSHHNICDLRVEHAASRRAPAGSSASIDLLLGVHARVGRRASAVDRHAWLRASAGTISGSRLTAGRRANLRRSGARRGLASGYPLLRRSTPSGSALRHCRGSSADTRAGLQRCSCHPTGPRSTCLR